MAVGCGSHTPPTVAALGIEREDLASVSSVLERIGPSVASEVAATKQVWPLIANGLPERTASVRGPVAAAGESVARVKLPALLEEAHAASLTGPAAELGGLFRTFLAMATPAWKLIGAAIVEIGHGSPASASFARNNVALYIESVYDAHFVLAQIGKQLRDDYRKLGGPTTFEGSLTQQTVDQLAATYSEATDRLQPHDGVRFGS